MKRRNSQETQFNHEEVYFHYALTFAHNLLHWNEKSRGQSVVLGGDLFGFINCKLWNGDDVWQLTCERRWRLMNVTFGKVKNYSHILLIVMGVELIEQCLWWCVGGVREWNVNRAKLIIIGNAVSNCRRFLRKKTLIAKHRLKKHETHFSLRPRRVKSVKRKLTVIGN